jgi:hypothetical protein
MADALLPASARQTSKPLSCVADGRRLLSCIDLSFDEIGCNSLACQLYAGRFICQVNLRAIFHLTKLTTLINLVQPDELYAFHV